MSLGKIEAFGIIAALVGMALLSVAAFLISIVVGFGVSGLMLSATGWWAVIAANRASAGVGK